MAVGSSLWYIQAMSRNGPLSMKTKEHSDFCRWKNLDASGCSALRVLPLRVVPTLNADDDGSEAGKAISNPRAQGP